VPCQTVWRGGSRKEVGGTAGEKRKKAEGKRGKGGEGYNGTISAAGRTDKRKKRDIGAWTVEKKGWTKGEPLIYSQHRRGKKR